MTDKLVTLTYVHALFIMGENVEHFKV